MAIPQPTSLGIYHLPTLHSDIHLIAQPFLFLLPPHHLQNPDEKGHSCQLILPKKPEFQSVIIYKIYHRNIWVVPNIGDSKPLAVPLKIIKFGSLGLGAPPLEGPISTVTQVTEVTAVLEASKAHELFTSRTWKMLEKIGDVYGCS